MAEERETIIVDINVDYDQAITRISQYKSTIDALKSDLKDLEKAHKDGAVSSAEYAKAQVDTSNEIKRLSQGMREVEKELNNQVKADQAASGSLKQLRAELSNATAAYDRLSAAEREGAKGKALTDHINQLSASIRTAEEATGRYQRSVGNYTNSITAAISGGNKFVATLISTASAAGGASAALKVASQSATLFGRSLLALLANPIVATLAAIVAVLKLFSEGISSSEENTNKFNAAMAPLKGVLDAVMAVVQKGVGLVLDLAGAFAKAATVMVNFMSRLPGIGNLFKGVAEGINNQAEAAKKNAEANAFERKRIEESAVAENKVAKLRAQATDKVNLSYEERKKKLEEAIAIEEKEAKENVKMAQLRLEALEAEARTTENTAEMNKKLSEAKAAVMRADTEYYNKTRRLMSQASEFEQQELDEQKRRAEERRQAAEKAAAAREQRRQKELEAVRGAEDEMTKLIKDAAERQRVEINLSYDRQIEDLRRRLATERDLTVTAKKALNAQIVALEKQKEDELSKLDDEAIKGAISRAEKYYSLVAENAGKGTKARFDAETAVREAQRQKEMAEYEGDAEMQAEIRKKYERLQLEAEQQFEQDKRNAVAKAQSDAFATKLLQMQNENASELEILKAQAEEKKRLYEEAEQGPFETAEEFALRKEQLRNGAIKADEAYNNAVKKNSEEEVKIRKDNAKKVASSLGTISQAFETLGENNKAFAKMGKVLALGEIMVNMGVAISEGIRSAAGVKFPATIPAIVSIIAQIVSGMTSAISTVKSAKFAEGGLVTGPGTGTSDSIPAMLSNGESVINARSTQQFAPLLSAINQAGGGAPIGSVTADISGMAVGATEAAGALAADAIAASVSDAMRDMPAPVVSVEEISRTQNRVNVIQTLGTV